MRMKHAVVMAGLALGLMSGNAEAAYILNVAQVGANVVAVGSGSLNVDGLFFRGSYSDTLGSGTSPNIGVFYVGDPTGYDYYTGVVGPQTLGPGSGAFSTINSGSYVGISGASNAVVVYEGYESGSDFGVSRSIFENTTIGELGLNPGTYTYYLGLSSARALIASDDTILFADTFTVNIGVSAVPLPASAPMFGAALLALGAVGYGVKRKKAAAAAA